MRRRGQPTQEWGVDLGFRRRMRPRRSRAIQSRKQEMTTTTTTKETKPRRSIEPPRDFGIRASPRQPSGLSIVFHISRIDRGASTASEAKLKDDKVGD